LEIFVKHMKQKNALLPMKQIELYAEDDISTIVSQFFVPAGLGTTWVIRHPSTRNRLELGKKYLSSFECDSGSQVCVSNFICSEIMRRFFCESLHTPNRVWQMASVVQSQHF
jgi:hypothetical protein